MDITKTSTEELKNIQMKDRKDFLSTKDYLCQIKADFKFINEGSVERIVYGNRCFVWVDVNDSGGRGHHLSKMFMRDIDKWLETNKPPVKDANYMEQMFHLDAIEEVIGEAVMMVDINDCYWRTAYLLGYITEETYIKGLRHKDWKVGRNACIGSLCKSRTILPYKNGVADRINRTIVLPRLEYQHIRNHIIGHIFNLFNTMFQQMGYTFYMFLTDCVVFRWDKVKYVETFLHGANYRTKLKTIEFTEIDRENKKVSWVDFGGEDKSVENRKEKYYFYSNAQVVQYHGERTDQLFHRDKGKPQ
jgi:hypothetical protein